MRIRQHIAGNLGVVIGLCVGLVWIAHTATAQDPTVLERVKLDISAGRAESAAKGLRYLLQVDPTNPEVIELAKAYKVLSTPLVAEVEENKDKWEGMQGPNGIYWRRLKIKTGWLIYTDTKQLVYIEGDAF